MWGKDLSRFITAVTLETLTGSHYTDLHAARVWKVPFWATVGVKLFRAESDWCVCVCHTHSHLHADAAADWKEQISVFLGFIPGIYRGLCCTGGALKMSRHRSQLRGPLWGHSEGSKQERGPPVRLHSRHQIGMILEVMKTRWGQKAEDVWLNQSMQYHDWPLDEDSKMSKYGAKADGDHSKHALILNSKQENPYNDGKDTAFSTLWACQCAWKSICEHSHAATSPKMQNSSIRKKNGGEEGDNQQQSACVSDGRVTGPSGRTG